ncbi:MAG: hypothetical protein E7428_00890 [Ruminococcaceae bacterium]|nr:hypothetical protein [Oscillospiraceae bacterium]
MGKGRWLAWLLLLVMTLAGCGTEAEVVTSEITFEEESESDSISIESENEPESESEVVPLRVPMEFEAKSYLVNGSDFWDNDPVVIHSVEELKNLFWSKDVLVWDPNYEAEGEWDWESIPKFSVQALDEEGYDELFFETKDLFLIPAYAGSGSFDVRVAEFLYIPESASYEVYINTESDSWGYNTGTGSWLMAISVEKGLMDNGEGLQPFVIRGAHVNLPYTAEGYTADGKHGVSIQMSYEHSWDVQPLADETAGEYGVLINGWFAESNPRVCYFENGFSPEPAEMQQEMTLSDGRVVVVGYDAKGVWKWVDFRDVSGCYGAVNSWSDGMDSRILLPYVLRAELGPRKE